MADSMKTTSILLLGLLAFSALAEAPSTVQLDAVLDHHAAAHGLPRDVPLERAVHMVADIEGLGLKGQLESWAEHPLHMRARIELGPLTMETGFDGKSGWMRDRNGSVRQAEGPEESGMLLEAVLATGAYVLKHPPIALRRNIQSIDDETIVLEITPLLGDPERLVLDAHSHRLLRSLWDTGQFDEEIVYDDYRWVDGLLLSHDMELKLGESMSLRAKTVLVELVDARGRDFYAAPPEGMVAAFVFPNPPDSGALPMRGNGQHILLDGKIGELEGRFLLDSGAGSNVLHTSTLEKLGLISEGAIEALGVGGSSQASFVDVDEVDLHGMKLKHQNWMTLDFSNLEYALGRSLLGVLGYDTFRRVVTHVHYGERYVRFVDSAEFRPPDDAVSFPLRLDANVASIEVDIEGIPAWVHVDTGSDNTLDLARPFVEQYKLLDDQEKLNESGVVGLGGIGHSQRGRVRSFRLGPYSYENLTAYFHEESDGVFENKHIAGIVGAGVLSDYECWFDYSRKTLWLRELASSER